MEAPRTPETPAAPAPIATSTAPGCGGPSGPRRWLLRGSALVAGLVGLLTLYALSMGPALRLNQRGVLRPETLEKIYLPLSVVTDVVPGSNELLDRYLALWVAPDPRLL